MIYKLSSFSYFVGIIKFFFIALWGLRLIRDLLMTSENLMKKGLDGAQFLLSATMWN